MDHPNGIAALAKSRRLLKTVRSIVLPPFDFFLFFLLEQEDAAKEGRLGKPHGSLRKLNGYGWGPGAEKGALSREDPFRQ